MRFPAIPLRLHDPCHPMPELPRRQPQMPFEKAGEIIFVVKPHLSGYLLDGHVSAGKQPNRVFGENAFEKLSRRNAGVCGETSGKTLNPHVHHLCHLRHGSMEFEIPVQIVCQCGIADKSGIDLFQFSEFIAKSLKQYPAAKQLDPVEERKGACGGIDQRRRKRCQFRRGADARRAIRCRAIQKS